jgi:capsule polysaccharide export protein KpsE/RkpR
MRSSGKHTEEHHVIRCLAPAKDDDAPATEERLISIEGRLDTVHARFNDLGGRIEDLTSRIGNIEQLLYKLTGISGTGAAEL